MYLKEASAAIPRFRPPSCLFPLDDDDAVEGESYMPFEIRMGRSVLHYLCGLEVKGARATIDPFC